MDLLEFRGVNASKMWIITCGRPEICDMFSSNNTYLEIGSPEKNDGRKCG